MSKEVVHGTGSSDSFGTDIQFLRNSQVILNDASNIDSPMEEESYLDTNEVNHQDYSAEEDILTSDNQNPYTMFPIKDKEIFRMYKEASASYWTPEEIDLTQDIYDWKNKLTEDEKGFIKLILAFFAASDGIVQENIALHFLHEVKLPEAKSFYSFQIAIESVHSETYSMIIDELIKDLIEKDRLFNSILNIQSIKAKADWCLKWILDKSLSFDERVVAFAVVEGIFFSSSFCSIFWLKKRGLMPGLCQSNNLISRDEGGHTEFACYAHKITKRKAPFKRLKEIITSGVALEEAFVGEALPTRLIGINNESMIQYVQYVADRLCVSLNLPKLWNVQNPFDWMEMISLQQKTNFFEGRETNYQKPGVVLSASGNIYKKIFNTEADF
jgi:ribonucleoside-diphosphate reductase beta chain